MANAQAHPDRALSQRGRRPACRRSNYRVVSEIQIGGTEAGAI
jgi:hypothetical protein